MLDKWVKVFLDGELNDYVDVFLDAISLYCDKEKLHVKTKWYRGVLEDMHGYDCVKGMDDGDVMEAMISDFKRSYKDNISLSSILELSDFESWSTLLDKVFDI